MSFILFEQLVIIGMGAFISFSAKKCRIYPIPTGTEIIGFLVGIGIVWLIHHIDDSWFSLSFGEQVRFILIGYLPVRVVRWVSREKDDRR